MDKKAIFGENLKKLRQKHGMTQKDIYEIMGCSQSTYSGYENGTSYPSLEMLINLCEHNDFNISIDELVGMKRPQKKNHLSALEDAIRFLFELEEKTPLRFHTVTVEENYMGMIEYPESTGPMDRFTIGFERYGLGKPTEIPGHYLAEFLGEWHKYIQFCRNSSDKEIGAEIYELWKNAQLKKASQFQNRKSFLDTDDELPFETAE